jgi:nicotinamidase-related amidase
VSRIQHANKGILAEGSDGRQFHTAMQPPASEPVVRKHRANVFEETDLQERLNSSGVGTVVMTGLVTHTCIKATCVGALDLGYEVVLVEDGHAISVSAQQS